VGTRNSATGTTLSSYKPNFGAPSPEARPGGTLTDGTE
jgi:hypothetical protein